MVSLGHNELMCNFQTHFRDLYFGYFLENAINVKRGWGQIRFFKYKYKYKYIFFRVSNTNTNTNTPAKIWSNTQIQIQIQIQPIKYKYKYKYTLRPRQNCRHFTDDIYSNSFYCKKIVLFIQISLKIVSKGPIYNKPGCLHWFRQWLGT